MIRAASLASWAALPLAVAGAGPSSTGPAGGDGDANRPRTLHPTIRRPPREWTEGASLSLADAFCPACPYQHSGQRCSDRLAFLMEEYYLSEATATVMLLEIGECVDPAVDAEAVLLLLAPDSPAMSPEANLPGNEEGGNENDGECGDASDGGCNWWANPLKAGGCATGPRVPPGRWDIYGTRLQCCQTNFPTSATCPVETSVVYYPATATTGDEFDVLAVRFDAAGLPREVAEEGEEREEAQRQMRLILKRVLLGVSYGVPGLGIAAVVERSDDEKRRRRRERRRQRREQREREGDRRRGLRSASAGASPRHLRRDEGTLSATYDVHAMREAGRREFGAILVEELRETYDAVLERIRTFPDTPYFAGDGLALNWCTLEDGRVDRCVREADPDGPSDASATGSGATTVVPTAASPPPGAAPVADTSDEDASGEDQGGIGLFAYTPTDGASDDPPPAAPDIFAAVPLRFLLTGLPEDVVPHLAGLRDEMLRIMKRNVLRASREITGMIFVSIDEGRVDLVLDEEGVTVAADYDVTVVREDGKDFGRAIVDVLGASYDDVVERIRLFGTRHIPDDAELDWCTVGDGGGSFAHCARDSLLGADAAGVAAPTGATPGPTVAPSARPTAATVGAEASTMLPSNAPIMSQDGWPAAAVDSCEPPAGGCGNGLFGRSKCQCECLRPYCPSAADGRCTATDEDCGGNPWTNCLRGVDCPWFVDPLKAESCTTGPFVPPGQWNVYPTLKECCAANHPHASGCAAEGGVVYYPTVAPPDVHAAVPLRFDVGGLPYSARDAVAEVRSEMRMVLDRVLLALEERIPGLKVPYVEERPGTVPLAPTTEMTVYYDVYVVIEDGKDFGTTIIDELRDSPQPASFSGTTHLSEGLDFKWCTVDGEYSAPGQRNEQTQYTYCAPIVWDNRAQSWDFHTSALPSKPTSSPSGTSTAANTPFPTAQYTPFPTAGFGQTTTNPTKTSSMPSAAPVDHQSARPTSNVPTGAPASDSISEHAEGIPHSVANGGGVFYPDFANGICLNGDPPEVSDKYLFDNASSCCTTFFRSNIQKCLSAKLPGERVWYPDYDNDRCLDDGQQGPFEINLFVSEERCCQFEWLNTGKCLLAMKDGQTINSSNQPAQNDAGSSKAAVIGGIAGGVAAFFLLCLAVCAMRRSKRGKDAAATEGCDSDGDEGAGHENGSGDIATCENRADEETLDGLAANSSPEDGNGDQPPPESAGY